MKTELGDITLLHTLGKELRQTPASNHPYKKIVDAAVKIMRSEYATMQLVYPDRGGKEKLRIIAASGFTPEAEKYWEWVYHYTHSSCGEVLRTRRRVIVSDYRTCDFMQNSPTLAVFIDGGVLAAQSTPLYSSTRKLLGMVSTHWSYPHTPSSRNLDLLDILAHHAADLLERTKVADTLREERN